MSKKVIWLLGASERKALLRQLPVSVNSTEQPDRIRTFLKGFSADMLIARCGYDDAAIAGFLQSVVPLKPALKTVVLLGHPAPAVERRIRSLGVTAVLDEQADDALLLDVVCSLLRLERPAGLVCRA